MNDKTRMEVERGDLRYRVEKTGYGFWPYCVRAGDGTRELFKGYEKQCILVARELQTAFRDGEFIAARASLPVDGVVVPIEFLKLINALGWVGPSEQIEKACEQLDALLASHEQQENGND